MADNETKDKIKHGGICDFGHFHPSEEQYQPTKEQIEAQEFAEKSRDEVVKIQEEAKAYLRNCVVGSKYIRENHATWTLLKLLEQFLKEDRIKIERIDDNWFLQTKDKEEQPFKINLNNFIKKDGGK